MKRRLMDEQNGGCWGGTMSHNRLVGRYDAHMMPSRTARMPRLSKILPMVGRYLSTGAAAGCFAPLTPTILAVAANKAAAMAQCATQQVGLLREPQWTDV